MLITFECPKCGSKLEIDAQSVGSQAECPECNASLTVPKKGVEPGTTVGGFRIAELLGKGGMGQVFLARQLSMDRDVALKILPPEFTAHKYLVDRFLNEVRMAARLEHPNIVRAYEAGEDSNTYYMAMAYVRGEGLDEKLQREGAMPEKDVLRLIRKVAEALAYAWDEHRILHRDIKPSNIMLDHRGEPQLTDMGLSKSLTDDPGMTLSGTVMGTPNYMSPEQAKGKSDIDFRADVYSLGATLYHMLTGKMPFESSSVVEVLQKQVTEALPDPRKSNPEISEPCVRLTESMLAKDPEQRYPDWSTLMGDIDRAVAGKHPSQAVLPPGQSVLLRADAVATTAGAEHKTVEKLHEKSLPQLKPKKRRSLVPLIAAAVAGMVTATGIGFVVMQKSKDSARPPPVAVEPVKAWQLEEEARLSSVAARRSSVVRQPGEGMVLDLEDSVKMEFLWIPRGIFTMGSPDDEDGRWRSEGPVHRVTIRKGFWMGKHEVTQEQYWQVTGSNPSKFKGASNPVEQVNWDDAKAFCETLGIKTGRPVRLPTEAEWEYACRAGATTRYCTGDSESDLGKAGWWRGNSGEQTHPVGQKVANVWGLHDMHGNVSEWCEDWYDANYYKESPPEDPIGLPWGSKRVVRGGSWEHNSRVCRSAIRFDCFPAREDNRLGFRLVVSVH